MDWICSTLVRLADGKRKGRVIHEGTEGDCQRIGDRLRLIGASILVRPAEEFGNIKAGEFWRS